MSEQIEDNLSDWLKAWTLHGDLSDDARFDFSIMAEKALDLEQALQACQQENERLADVIDDLIIHSWDDGSTKRIPKVEWDAAINREMDLLKTIWAKMGKAALEGESDE